MMKNDAKSGAGRGRSDTKRWAAIERRLSGLFESSPPHVRQNLATMAALLADEPAALDALARLAAEATDDVAQKRGRADEVLRSAIVERDRLKPSQRDRFDDRLKANIAEKWPRWDIAPAVDALLRLGFPVRALPVEAFANAILEEAGHFTPGDGDQGDTSIRERVGERLRQFARVEGDADEKWRRALREVLLAKFRKRNRRDRGTIQLALLRLWPALIAPENDFSLEPLASGSELNYAASLGRGGAFGRIWKVVAGAATAGGLLVLLIFTTLLMLGLPFESDRIVQTSIIGDGLFAFATLLGGGTIVGVLVAFLYVPTAGRRLGGLMLLRQLVVPATVGAIAAALVARLMPTSLGFKDDDKILLPVFAAAAVVLATMLRTLHGISLRPRSDLPERQDIWYIAIVSAPAILVSLALALAVHMLGRPGAGVFALLITIVAAAASGVWSVEERNQPADAWQGVRTAGRTYRLAKAAAILALTLAAATIPLAYQSKLRETVPLTADNLHSGRVSVPVGRPFTLKPGTDNPYWLPPQEFLLVRDGSVWKTDFPRDLKLEGKLMCVECTGFPEFSDWLSMFLRTPGNRERERRELTLVPAARPGRETSLVGAPSLLDSISTGTPILITVPAGSHYGFHLDDPHAGYIVTGVEGTHFHNQRPATPATATDDASASLENAMDVTSTPPLFDLNPGTYRICVFLIPKDEPACRNDPDRSRKWVYAPEEVRLAVSPLGFGS